MPLLPGKKNIGKNYKKMKAEGYPDRVAKAASLNKAYGPKKTKAVTGSTTKRPKRMTTSSENRMAKPKMGNMRKRRGKL